MQEKYRIKSYTDYCKYAENKVRILVDYEVIHIAGEYSPSLVKLGFSCPYSNSCTIDDTNNCPLFHKAP